MGEAHDVHGLHGLLEVVFVLLARNGNVSVGQEAIVIEALQQEISYRKNNEVLNLNSPSHTKLQERREHWACEVQQGGEAHISDVLLLQPAAGRRCGTFSRLWPDE